MNIYCAIFGHRNRRILGSPYLESNLVELDWNKGVIKYYRSPLEYDKYKCKRCGKEHRELSDLQMGNLDKPYIAVIMPDNWLIMPPFLKEQLSNNPDSGLCSTHKLPIYNLWDEYSPNKCRECDCE